MSDSNIIKPMSCGAQDMLEAAIVQKRRINLTLIDNQGDKSKFTKVLPVDIRTEGNQELLTFMTTDNQNGIIKLSVPTTAIVEFEAIDFNDPRIQYQRN